MAPPRIPLADRFWSKVDKNGPVPPHRPELGPCWTWLGATRGSESSRYGAIDLGSPLRGTMRPAHSVAFFLATGAWPMPCGLHRCDNPLCVNPSHIFAGTQGDNMRDRSAKGRARNQNSSKTHCLRGHPLSGGNVYANQKGRRCKTCRRADSKATRDERKAHST